MKLELLRVPWSGGTLAVLAYEPRRPRGVSLVAGHGYSSSKHNLDFLAYFLATHGYAVFNLDFPGHKLGASGGRLEARSQLFDAMGRVVKEVQRRRGGPVYTLGHSMGAMTALLTCARDASIAGAISIATGYGRLGALESMGGAATVDLRSGYVDGLTLQELVQGADSEYDAALPKLAGRPTLYIAGDRDFMVRQTSVEALFERAPEPKTFSVIASDHTFAADNARAAVLAWLNAMHPRT